MTIGEKIKYLRKQKSVTHTELVQLTGIHQVSIAKYEKDKMIPQPEQPKFFAHSEYRNV